MTYRDRVIQTVFFVLIQAMLVLISLRLYSHMETSQQPNLPTCNDASYAPICQYKEQSHNPDGVTVSHEGDYRVDCDRTIIWCDDEGS